MPLREVLEVPHAPLHEVGHLQHVRQDVIAVEAHQRVGVEHDRGHARREHGVEGELVEELPLAGVEPDMGRGRRHRQLEDHAPRAHRRPPPLAGEGPAGRGVDVGGGKEHQQHEAELGHLTAEALGEHAVPGLVDGLDREEDHREPEPAGGRDGIAEAAGEVVPAGQHVVEREPDPRGPEEQAPAVQQRAEDWLQPRQDAVGIEEPQPQVHDPDRLLGDPPLHPLAPAAQQLLGLGEEVDGQQVGAVHLAEELDHFLLRRRAVAVVAQDQVPGVLDAPVAVEQADHLMGDRAQAVEMVGGRVVDDVPAPAAVVLAGDLHVGAQPGLEGPDPVPQGRECRALKAHD